MKRLLLIGGGHAHVEVLRRIARQQILDTEVLLISPGRFAAYTGMVPGYLAGHYQAAEMRCDLAALAGQAGATYIDAAVQVVDGPARIAEVAGRRISFDACSLDVGSAPAGWDVPGVDVHALPLRPLENVELLGQRFDALLRARGRAVECVVVGGGAGGVEVALALAVRGNGAARITLVHGDDVLLPGYPLRAQRLAHRACTRSGVAVRTGHAVRSVAADHVVLVNDERIPSALTVWLAGAAPPSLMAHATLPRSSRGYFEVDRFLRATDGSPVWGAGDCITLRDDPNTPKAGVYAVRQGPVLAHNLRVICEARGAAQRYRPQGRFLSLLSVDGDRAVLSWGGVALEARWAQQLKQVIDRRFMARYRVGSTALPHPMTPRRRTIVMLALFGGAILGWRLLAPLGLNVADAAGLIRSWGMWGAVGSIGLMIVHSVLPFPAEVLAIANGMVYGPLWGSVITWIGAMLGASAAFGLARWLGRPFLRRVVSAPREAQLVAWSLRHGGKTMLLARLIPVVAFNLINYAAALTPIPWWTFLWTTGVGILPFTIVLNVFGTQLWHLPPWSWLPLGAVTALAWLLLRQRLRPNE